MGRPFRRRLPIAELDRLLEDFLSEDVYSAWRLSREHELAEAPIAKRLRELEVAGRVYNVGFSDAPLWVWRIGNATPTHALRQLVMMLLRERPMYARDLIRATDASEKRVDGVVVELRRYPPEGWQLVNVPTANRPHGRALRYYLIADEDEDVELSRRTRRRG